MEVVHGISKLSTQVSKSVVTIGNFDGLHFGHREIISKVLEKANAEDAQSVVFTFHPHPRKILKPDSNHVQLFDYQDQEKELSKLRVNLMVIEPFSRDLSQLTPEQFFTDYIIKPLSPVGLVVGYDFAFGANRQGTLSVLEKLCETHGVSLDVVHPVKMDGIVISSSAIRKSIKEGHVHVARSMLGRSFYLKGLVEKGDQRGRLLGFPTANLSTSAEVFPKVGVYASYTKVRSEAYKSVTNVGFNPTFVDNGEPALKVETHIFNFDKDIYGEEIEIQFEHYIREEKKFESLENLKAQIQNDVNSAKALLEPQTC